MKLIRSYIFIFLGLILLTQSFTVQANCDPRFSYQVDTGCLVHFRVDSVIRGVYHWNFGDGNFGFSTETQHQFELPQGQDTASFQVTLRHIGERCVDSLTKTVFVSKLCESRFSYFVGPDYVQFVNLSEFKDSSRWSVNGQVFLNQDTIIFPFKPSLREQYVYAELTSSSPGRNCATLVRDSILILPNPCYSSFDLAIDTTNKFTLYLINRSFDLPENTYRWIFGDGTESNERNPTHAFAEFGKYTICLGVSTNDDSCVSEFCDEIGLDKDGKLLKQDGFEIIVIDAPLLNTTNQKKQKPKLYPNPVQNSLYYENENWATYSIHAFDGTQLMEGSLEKRGTIDVTNLGSGIYTIHFYGKGQFNVQRIIKN